MPAHDMNRRALISLGGAAIVAGLATPAGAVGTEGPIGGEILPLWPGLPPGSPERPPALSVIDHGTAGRIDRVLTGIATPLLTIRRAARPNGMAALLMPGGGYVSEWIDNEGTSQADWLNARGITAFILTYRLPAEGWRDRSLAPLQDAQRAMRLIRHHAATYGVDPRRIVVIGFSAGGHLAGSIATRFAEPVYTPVDAADGLSARPDYAGLIYPVISMEPGITHAGSRAALIGGQADGAATAHASVDRRVDGETPPCLMIHAADDNVVPVENSLLMYQAMLARKRPAAMHLFETGGHGFGVKLPRSAPAAAWPELLLAQARLHLG
ncbi:alpha/beta hydrolase [Sphingobium sp. CAP-1]|uniref:alpha/beta hydrolase n=1 Tax=Sphingobium sp. CAP-1 TaxID=2676077 RepID=UPI0012BB300E|nr:alpha/beta hydrolase [Sphingobium sp. CAP-1]QGP80380.1 alpha/beta hydrolase fold domain-containing protein [Sphingobium sp. CAP-1]